MCKIYVFVLANTIFLLSNIVHAKELPENNILGFGTQRITAANSELIQEAINSGHRLFDGAQLYKNTDIIAPILKANKRDNLYFIYKISPPRSTEEAEKTLKQVHEIISSLGYIDCLMFHSVETFFDGIDKDYAKNIIEGIKKLIANKTVGSFGLSNVGGRYREILQSFKEQGLMVSLIENHFNNNKLNDWLTKGLISFCKEHRIAFIAYGALGGVQNGGPCVAHCNIMQPVIHFDPITHPNIISIAKKHDVDPMMLVLAFEAKRYGVHHIPTTTKKERVKTNFDAYAKAYQVLTEEDLNTIRDDLDNASDEEFAALPETYKKSNSFRSRLRLVKHLIETNDPTVKTIAEFNFLFDSNSLIFTNKMLHIAEQARKLGITNDLSQSLTELLDLMPSSDSKNRFIPILKNIFNLDTNEAPGHLVTQFLQTLKNQIGFIRLLQKSRFELINHSDESKTWPARNVMVIDIRSHKIVQFTVQSPFYRDNLMKILEGYGIQLDMNLQGIGSNGLESYNLETMDKNLDLAGHWQSMLPSMLNWFSIGPDAKEWLIHIGIYNPFTYPELYGTSHF
jgi:diketogulonate reductase-like aldo/keto reductase